MMKLVAFQTPLSATRRLKISWPSLVNTRCAARTLALAVVVALGVAACAAPEPRDLSAFHAAAPRSILVLPPLNESPAVEAGAGFLSTISQPLAEQGYYVFPVAVVEALMKANGLPTAGEMHQVPIARLRDVTGADAILYATIRQYGSQFQIVSSMTRVTVAARLIDARSGVQLWSGQASEQNDSGSAQGGLLEQLLLAAIVQAVASSTDASRPVAARANWQLIRSPDEGLPVGPLHPEYVPVR